MNELKTRIDQLDAAQRERLRALLNRAAQADSAQPRREPRSHAPLALAQRRLWLLAQMGEDEGAYNIPGAFIIRGALQPARLQRALGQVAQRHEILRTTFDTDAEGLPRQVIRDRAQIDWRWQADALPDAAARQGFAQALLRERIDLRNGPCWRVALAPCGGAPGAASDRLPGGPDHLLVLSFQHIVFDGASLGLFVRELFDAYADDAAADRQPEPQLQYSDYVTWQTARFSPAQRQREQAFWQQQLADAPEPLDLPADRPRPLRPSHRGGFVKHLLPLPLFERVKAYARAADTTPYAVCLAAYACVLARHSGQTALVLGTPVSGRQASSLATMLGVFVNTVPIQVALPAGGSFAALVAQVRDTSLAAFEHATLPFDEIVEAVNPARLPGRHPVFQVLYTYQNAVPPVRAAGLRVAYEDFDQGSAKFELSLDVVEGPQGPSCLWEYRSELFDRARIERMAAQFEVLLRAAIDHPETACDRLALLPPDELARVCASLHAPRLALPAASFVQLFEQRVAEQGDAVALRVDGQPVRYAALNAAANRLARALLRRGLRPGVPVATCLPRGARLVEALLAVLKIGCPFLALDPAHPAQRLAFMLDDAQAQAVVVDQAGAALLTAPGLAPLAQFCLDGHAAELGAADDAGLTADLGHAIAPAQGAYIVYTSGTTGLPKGVLVSHGNVVNAFLGWDRVYGLTGASGLRSHLQMAACSFDVFCGDLVRALGSGATLVLCPQPLLAEPDRLLALIEAEQVEAAEFVPAVFRLLAEHLQAQGRTLPHVKLLVVASDNWYVHEYRRYRTLLQPAARLVNSYGMAEATVDSSWFDGDVAGLPDGALVPVGQPFPNVELLLLDAHGQPVPEGAPGEICVGGLGVALGYLNRPALNAARFVAHPLAQADGARLYRSGDIGRWAGSGGLELLGRRDSQVKLNGMRIELGEVELALTRHAVGVRAAAAVVREQRAGPPRLLVFVVAEPGARPSEAAIKDALLAHLPAAMVPARIVLVDALPLSASGKVDRARLPSPDSDEAGRGRGFVSPRTLGEEMLATLWGQVFRLPRVGVHDNFFELGGHSLLAMQLVQRAREVFAVDLALRTLFEHPTIAGLAAAIRELQGTRGAYDDTVNAVPQITPDRANQHLPFPMTEVQQAYWLGRNEVFEFGNVSTHSYDEMETEVLDAPRFERAWNRVVARHPMLRTVILPDGLQQILPEVPVYRLPVLDLSALPPQAAQAQLEALRHQMSHQMLDVHRWPVFDVRLTVLDAQRTRIHFSSDALMFDVWSFVIIIEDLVRAYLDESLVLPPLDLSFRDYVLAEQAMHDTPRYHKALQYWRERTATLPPAPELPMAMDPSQLAKPRFTRLHETLDAARWQRLKLRAVRSGMTTTALMLAAYAEVLAAYSRDPAFSLNLTFLNRHPLHPQVNDIVGEFTSLTLLSVDSSLDDTFVARARRIQGDLWNDLEHHAISGVQVLRNLTRSRGGATRAKMPVVFTSALVVPIPQRRPDLPITPVYRDGVTQTSQVWLDCGVWEDQGQLLCNWDVVLELYPSGLVQEMFAAYWALVQRLVDDDAAWQAPLHSVLPAQPRWQADNLALPALAVGDETLDTLFLNSLARKPGATAVICGERHLSYADVAGHMAFVAQALDGRVQRGELVAVAMDKGWEQVPAVLGVLISGAAYLPLDPALPDERLRELLADAGVRSVVTVPAQRARFAALAGQAPVVVDAQALAPVDLLYAMPGPSANDLAYTLFTSGSSGKPKGVMIDHRGAVNTLLDLIDRYALTDRLCVLALSSLSFDLSVFDIFGTLAAGGTVVIPLHERRLDPTHWLALLQRHGVTVWNSVPALATLLIDHVEQAGTRLPQLQRVMLSGDWIAVTLPDRLRNACPQAGLTSLGGATEASIWSVLYDIGPVSPLWKSIPYGRAMRNQKIDVLNDRLEPCPTWVVGQIHLGGIGLALGYWGDTARSEAAFVAHPGSGERWYRAGDLGRRLPDGNIEFLGRNDTQVKVQGYRIELGEIESVMARHPAIADAVAVAVGERHSEKRLGGFYVARPGQALTPEALRHWLRGQLPEYMVPLALAPIERLPLSRNGKVDRAALPALFDAPAAAAADRVPPRDAFEAQVAAIWCDVLKLDQVGVFDDFFAVGGDSMLAIKLLASLRHRLGVDYQLKDIFRLPQVAALADKARQESAAGSTA